MNNGSTNLDSLLELLRGASSSAYVKVAACLSGDRWLLRYLNVIVGPQPPGWSDLCWKYEATLFFARQVSGQQVVDALAGSANHDGQFSDFKILVPALAEQVNWRREPSFGSFDGLHLPWPTRKFEMSARDQLQPNWQTGLLIGDECPSFPDYREAFETFFYGIYTSGRSAPSYLVVLRMVESGAWLSRVRITPTHVEIAAGGDEAVGARIELRGDGLAVSKTVGKTRRVRIPLRRSIPQNAWLYLSKAGSWLDYRALGFRLATGERSGLSGVEVVYPDDPSLELDALLASGEGPQVEYKRALPGTEAPDVRKVLKTVAAFANGDGGTLVFGVEPDEATVIGIDRQGLLQSRDRLSDLIRRHVVPTPIFEVRVADRDGAPLMLLEVKRGARPPYGVEIPPDKPVAFYVRRSGTSYPAKADEIRALARRDL